MEKLNTANLKQVDWAIDSTVKYIKQWSQKELENLFDSKQQFQHAPIIVQLADSGYIVGNYAILKTNEQRWQLNYRYSDFERIFDDKKSALVFAICYQTGKMKLADKIYNYDLEVAKLSDKVQFFKYRTSNARRNKNYDKSEFYQIRLNEYNMRLSNARVLLEKNIKTTKYI